MIKFFQKKTAQTKVAVHYVGETRKKLTNGIVLFNPGNLFVYVLRTKKSPFMRTVEKVVLFERLEAVWGVERFFSDAVIITEKVNTATPWFTNSFKEILKKIQEKPDMEIEITEEKVDEL